jgi:hypothetical protein
MKVSIQIQLNLGNHYDSATDAELRQLIFDQFIHLPAQAHAEAAANTSFELARGTTSIEAGTAAIQHYKRWFEIAAKPKWTLKITRRRPNRARPFRLYVVPGGEHQIPRWAGSYATLKTATERGLSYIKSLGQRYYVMNGDKRVADQSKRHLM